MTSRLGACILLLTASSCIFAPDDAEDRPRKEEKKAGPSDAEKRVRMQNDFERAQRGESTADELPGVKLNDFGEKQKPPPVAKSPSDAPEKTPRAEREKPAQLTAPGNEGVDAGQVAGAADAGVATDHALEDGWKNAVPGDFARVHCVSDVMKFGNQVVRTVDLSLAVVDADADTVTIAIDANTSEDRPKTRSKTKPRKVEKKDSFLVTVSKTAEGEPALPKPLGALKPDKTKVGDATVDTTCSRNDPGANGGLARELCVATDPTMLYFTNGLVKQSLAQKSKDTNLTRKCALTALGEAKLPPNAKRLDAAAWSLQERGGTFFREAVISASPAAVKVQFDRLTVAKKTEKDAVEFDGQFFKVGVRDTKTYTFLDWALHRAMPEFPTVLSEE